MAKIAEDGGLSSSGVEPQDNIEATKYQKRTGNRANLEASNQLFIDLVEAMHSAGDACDPGRGVQSLWFLQQVDG